MPKTSSKIALPILCDNIFKANINEIPKQQTIVNFTKTKLVSTESKFLCAKQINEIAPSKAISKTMGYFLSTSSVFPKISLNLLSMIYVNILESLNQNFFYFFFFFLPFFFFFFSEVISSIKSLIGFSTSTFSTSGRTVVFISKN